MDTSNATEKTITHWELADYLKENPSRLLARSVGGFTTTTRVCSRGRPRKTVHFTRREANALIQTTPAARTARKRIRFDAYNKLDAYFAPPLEEKYLRVQTELVRVKLEAKESRAAVVELEARLELQNRHLKRHQEFTRETHETIKALKEELARKCDVVGADSQARIDTARINELEAEVEGLRKRLAPPKVLNIEPLGRFARPGWFSHRTAPNQVMFEGFRNAHGIQLLAELGLCDLRGIPNETGTRYSRPDGRHYKWDMGILDLMDVQQQAA